VVSHRRDPRALRMERRPFAPSVPGMTSTSPFRVVVAGGGVAGIEALLTLRDLGGDRLDVTLVEARPDFVHKPLLIADLFLRERVRHVAMAEIARDTGARLVADDVVAVDDDEQVVVTSGGERLRYDALLLATGVTSEPAYGRALTWDERTGNARMAGLIADIEGGFVRRLAFVVPHGPGWPLPAYELALMTAQHAWNEQQAPEIALVTPEAAPLAVFGPTATAAIRTELEEAGIAFHGCSYADVEPGTGTAAAVVLHPGLRRLDVDRVVALPRLVGRPPAGVPADATGFLAVDAHGRVHGLRHVWAAGDGIAFPVKFGGLAAEQADAAAESIAASAGAAVVPQPFRPVLRGQLLTGTSARFLRYAVAGGGGEGVASPRPLWWPPGKVAGLRIGPYLARRDHTTLGDAGMPEGGIALQTDLALDGAPAA
jgi:sulfide:quinone oxidoreductase